MARMKRLKYPSLRACVIEHARAYTPNKILVEDAGIGMGLIQDSQKAGKPAVAVKPERNKKTRMQIQSDKFAAGSGVFSKVRFLARGVRVRVIRFSERAF
jgi:phage terminase large subunit-like protein